MDRTIVAVAIGMALVFGVGVIAGVLVVVSMAIRREDKRRTLTLEPPDVVARGVRRLTRVGMRDITVQDYVREGR